MIDEADQVAEADRSAAESRSAMRGMFGRDSIYLAMWATQLILAALLTPVTTRLLGPSRFGVVAVSVAVMQVLVAFGGFSLQIAVQRAYSQEDGERRARTLVGLAAIIAGIAFVVAFGTGTLWAPLLSLGHFTAPMRLAVIWAALTAVSNAALGLIRSQDRIVAFAVVSLLQSVVAEALALALVIFVHRTASEYLLGQVLAQGAAVLVSIVIARPKRPRFGERAMLADALVYSAALVPTAVSAFVLDASDRLVIQAHLGSIAVARYAVARNIGGFALILLGVLNSVWLPRLFALKDEATQRSVLTQSRDAVYVLLLAAVVAVAMASPLLLWLWVPSSYQPQHLLVITTLIAVTALPVSGALAATRVLVVRSRTRPIATGTFLAAALNLGLNLVLVPIAGIEGSALATLISYSVQLAVLNRAANRVLRLPRPSAWLLVASVLVVAVSLASTQLGGGVLPASIRAAYAAGAVSVIAVRLLMMIAPDRAARLGDRLPGRGPRPSRSPPSSPSARVGTRAAYVPAAPPVAAIIMAHGDADQVRRLARSMTGADIFLHCDLRTPASVFDAMTRDLGSDVRLVPRTRTTRTSWSLVQAELRAIGMVLDTTRAEHIVVMSGNCYPLTSMFDLADELTQWRGLTQMPHVALPFAPWDTPRNPDGGMWRFRRQFVVVRGQTIHVRGVPLRTLRRAIPPELSLHGGSQWKIYAREHARKLIEVLSERPDLVSFFRSAYVPDESCVATILKSRALVGDVADEIVPRSRWYLEWPAVGQSPEWLRAESFARMSDARMAVEPQPGHDPFDVVPKLFARKLRSSESLLLDRIDEELRV